MNFTPIALFDLKPVDPAENRKNFRGQETVTILADRINISAKMYEKLGKPAAVEFVTDAAKNIIGIRAAEDGSKYALPVYDRRSGITISSSYLPGALNLKKINLNSRYIILNDPWKDSGYYLFDADKAYVQKRKAQKGK